MKKAILVILSLLLAAGSVFAQTGDDFKIAQNAQVGITITGYTGKDKNVVIPSTIEGIKVTEIGTRAFLENKDIISVSIPDSVINIGAGAFSGCESLISITIPDSVTRIDYGAFGWCGSLISVTFQGTIPLSGFSTDSFDGDLRARFYARDKNNGTPGTYTTTGPVSENSKWRRIRNRER